ncbi:nuclear transport factor 2 family protein [Streptomyces physcomitrii]|uniref:Epoxide hydrolase n=3 Tax=Streptomyces TaxID=1883 RepID=H6D586_STRA4|nr:MULTISPECIES: nuclear transport factor 2 family protein [Bacteria]AEZ53962.1 putative epoxide hydrolase [Streptomyces albus]CCD31907.1 putative epoxide hydrolase/cyclase [Streptomyces albus subsp. albus]AJE80639.1 Epoxide hydrolase [Streptomyces albus]AOU74950.1 NigBI [Streptomyces albus]NKI43878.1 SnoaL-like domain-containing protein [Streptomyces physcomitrii]
MLDEAALKELILEHTRRVNAGDVEGLLKLYSPEVRFEDPVGAGAQQGHEALRAHATGAVTSNAVEIAGRPVAAQDGLHAAVPVTATMDYLPLGPVLTRYGVLPTPADPTGQRMQFQFLMVIRAGADGLIEDMRAYWGTSDVALVDAAQGGAHA